MYEISPIFKQFLSITCCNLLTLSLGVSTGWATINFIELQSTNTTFPTGPLSLDESSLVVSLINIGGLIGNFAILPISQFVGIKRTIHLFGLPLIISAMLTIYAQNVYYLYAARLLSGVVGGSLVVGIPTFVNDISNDNVRGALNSLYDPSYNSGIIISYFLGNYLSCLDQAKTQIIVPIIFMILMIFLPESPEYWTARNKEKRAIKSRKFYKSPEAIENDEFLHKLRDDKIEDGNRGKDNNDNELNSNLTLKDFCTPQARKAFLISLISLLLSFSSGPLVILSYVTDIFTKTGSSLSAKNSSLLISITQIVGNLVFLYIIERIDRRTLYIASSILTSISFFLFGAYCLFWFQEPDYEWMPPFCFACIIYFSCMGLLPIPYIITMEIFPKKIRQVCLAFAVSMVWIVLFIIGTIFPVFLESFDLLTCMITLGCISFLNVIVGFFLIPETRGKSYEEIMDLLK